MHNLIADKARNSCPMPVREEPRAQGTMRMMDDFFMKMLLTVRRRRMCIGTTLGKQFGNAHKEPKNDQTLPRSAYIIFKAL